MNANPELQSGNRAGPPRRSDAVCAHCGLPVPTGLIEPEQDEQFCCNGCRAVYAVIHGCGLQRYYKLRGESAVDSAPARTTGLRYDEYDDDTFRDLYVRPLAGGEESVEFYLEGVHCAACVWLVERLPRIAPGVVETRLDMRRSLVQVRWDPAQISLSRIARSLDSLGYAPHPAKNLQARSVRKLEERRLLVRIGVAAACAGNVMMLAIALYGGTFSGIESQYSHFFRLASTVLGLISLCWPGSLFFRGAWAALRTRTAHLDLPIAIALAAGGIAGTVNAVTGHGEIYFDSLTMLVLLLLVGRWFQYRQQLWTADSLELLFSLTPTSARRMEGDCIREVPVEAISPGDLVEVRTGESVVADGTIVEGRSAVDQSLLTGESRPAMLGEGDRVHAGTVNLSARLIVRVEAVGVETRVGRLLSLIEECGRRRAPLVRFADRVAGGFVVVVVCLALATLCVWLRRDANLAVDRAVAVLIVTCPCALGLATPLAITVALGRAASRRILVKGGDALEHLSRRGTIVLDKTGTLTAGRLTLVDWIGSPEAKFLAASLESHSSHPVALAIVAAAADGKPDQEPLIAEVKESIGGGITGTVDGRRVVVGSSRFARLQGVFISEDFETAERGISHSGRSPVIVGVDGRCMAIAGMGDPIGADVAVSLQKLRQMGWRTRIVSGDHQEVVASVGRELGFDPADAVGGVSPEEKVECVQTASGQGVVVMAGDGINDAAALAAATVGIAVHRGAEVSLSVADVYLSRAGIGPIVELMAAARNTVRTIHRSFAVSLAYNIVAATLAVTGLIGPLGAAVLMPISSFSVLALAYLSPTFRGEP